MNIILTKWLEPYVLLETLKKHYDMQDLTFDGSNKIELKNAFLNALKEANTVGLYMKNVNKFYIFSSENNIDITTIFEFDENDFYKTEDIDEPFNMIDLGKAEASFFIL
ncbi:MAG: hypothetical protein R3Y28_04970 [Candidatus Gastranaerophilales bacterium]